MYVVMGFIGLNTQCYQLLIAENGEANNLLYHITYGQIVKVTLQLKYICIKS